MEKKQQTETRLTVRFVSGMLEALRTLAQEHKRSLNGEVLWGLQFYIDHCRAEKEKNRANAAESH